MKNITIGIGGSSGSIYGKVLTDRLQELIEPEKVAVIMSKNAKYNWQFELGNQDYKKLPFRIFNTNDPEALYELDRRPATDMIVAPCSMGLIGRIAAGTDSDAITAAASRALQWRKKLLLIFRDKPLSIIHTQNILKIQQAGGIVIPATPSFYTHAEGRDALAQSVVDRSLDLLGFELKDTYRWGETEDDRL